MALTSAGIPAVAGPGVAVGVLLAVYGNDAAIAISAAGVLLMTVAAMRAPGVNRPDRPRPEAPVLPNGWRASEAQYPPPDFGAGFADGRSVAPTLIAPTHLIWSTAP